MSNSPDSLPRLAEELMPHSGVMCMIDKLVTVDADFADTTVWIKASNPFLRADGTIEECVFIEMVAQSIAARSGFDLVEEKLKRQKGYLLGIKNMKVLGSARMGDELRIRVSKVGQYGDFSIIEGHVFKGKAILAYGEIKVVQIIEPNPEGDA